MNRTLKATLCGAGACAALLIAASACGSTSGAKATPGGVAPSVTRTHADAVHPASADVMSFKLSSTSTYGVSDVEVPYTLVNHSGKTSDYDIAYEIVNKAGARVYGSDVLEMNVTAGETVKGSDMVATLDSVSGDTLRITHVDRTQSLN
jgi:hypothetical protein